jgi:hypothetical protein
MLAFGRSACRPIGAALHTVGLFVSADAAECREESGFSSNPWQFARV